MTVGDLVGTGRLTVAGSCERTTELRTVAGRKTVLGSEWWSTVGRFWVDGEREGKFGGKLGEEKCENEKDEVLLQVLFSNFENF
jgi:hypothetical protein